MKLFKIRDSKDSHLIMDGNRVVNGAYEMESQEDGKVMYRKYPLEFYADYVCDIPHEIKGWKNQMEWYYINKSINFSDYSI